MNLIPVSSNSDNISVFVTSITAFPEKTLFIFRQYSVRFFETLLNKKYHLPKERAE